MRSPKRILLFDMASGEIKVGGQEISSDLHDYKLISMVSSKEETRVEFLAKRLSLPETEVLFRIDAINKRCGYQCYRVKNGCVDLDSEVSVQIVLPNKLFARAYKVEGVS